MTNVIEVESFEIIPESDEALDQQVKDETAVLNQMRTQTIEQGIKVGKLYKEKKSSIHKSGGNWSKWVDEKIGKSLSWSDSLIKLSDNESLIHSLSKTSEPLIGITQALKFIRKEEAKNKPPKHEPIQSEVDKKLRIRIEDQIFDKLPLIEQKVLCASLFGFLHRTGAIDEDWINDKTERYAPAS